MKASRVYVGNVKNTHTTGENNMFLVNTPGTIQISCDGQTFDFDKKTVGLTASGPWITLSGAKESLQFLFTEIKNPKKNTEGKYDPLYEDEQLEDLMLYLRKIISE